MNTILPITVALSASVSSGHVALGAGELLGIWCPTVTSGDLYLRASYDTTSADYVRVQQPVTLSGSGDLKFGVGVGSSYLPTGFLGNVGPFVKLETSVPQAAARIFQLCIMSVR